MKDADVCFCFLSVISQCLQFKKQIYLQTWKQTLLGIIRWGGWRETRTEDLFVLCKFLAPFLHLLCNKLVIHDSVEIWDFLYIPKYYVLWDFLTNVHCNTTQPSADFGNRDWSDLKSVELLHDFDKEMQKC